MKLLEYINQAIYGPPKRMRGMGAKFVMDVLAQPTFQTIDKSKVWGIDISGDYDGIVDCQKLKDAGASFIIIKCANGSLPTRLYKENYDAARKAGLIVGAYQWLYRAANVPIGSQVSACLLASAGRPADFWMVDFEWTYWMGQPSNPTTSDLWGMIRGLEMATGKKPPIYSAPGYLNEFFNGDAVFLSYPLAIAQYKVSQPNSVKPWGTAWSFWQAADNADGSQLGVDPKNSKAEDLDYWRGTLDELKAFLGISDPPAPIPTPVPVPDPVPVPTPAAQWQITEQSDNRIVMEKK